MSTETHSSNQPENSFHDANMPSHLIRDNMANLEYAPPSPEFINEITGRAPDISNQTQYLRYLDLMLEDYRRVIGPVPQKAHIQQLMAKAGINEAASHIINPRDLGVFLKYATHLFENEGARELWVGTCMIDDHSSPQGKQNLTPPLYRNIHSVTDLLALLPEIMSHSHQHPDLLLKVFPQDGVKPALGSMVVADNQYEQVIHLKLRLDQYTSRQRDSSTSPRVLQMSVDISRKTPIIRVNTDHATAMHWLDIILNSTQIFRKLDELKLSGSNYINPEFLIFENGEDTEISFFTDVIWGSVDNKSQHKRCPEISPKLAKLQESISNNRYITTSNKNPYIYKNINKFKHAVLNTLLSARSPNPDAVSAESLLQLREVFNHHNVDLGFEPLISPPIVSALNRISKGRVVPELTEQIEYLKNNLRV